MSTAPVGPPVWQCSDAALVAKLGALETRLHSTWAQMLSVVTEIDSRATAATVGYPTTVELVRAVTRVPLGEARARIAAATDLLPSRGLNGAPVEPKLPATAAAVAEHAIGAADVRVIRSILTRIPPHLGDDKRAEVEAELAHNARTLDAGQLMVLGKRIEVDDHHPLGSVVEAGGEPQTSLPQSTDDHVAAEQDSNPKLRPLSKEDRAQGAQHGVGDGQRRQPAGDLQGSGTGGLLASPPIENSWMAA